MSAPKIPGIDDYRALIAFADRGNVIAAAKSLGWGQPMISRRLQVFQGGEPLLEKQGRVLVLTAHGKALLPEIRNILHRFDQISRTVHRRALPSQRFSLGTGHYSAEHYLPMVAARLRSRLPDVSLQLRLVRGEQRILETASGKLDLAIVTHDENQVKSIVFDEHRGSVRLSTELLATQSLYVAAHRSTPCGMELAALPKEQAVSWRQLARWPLHGLDPDSGVRLQIQREFRENDEQPNYITEGGDWHVARAFVSAGLGVAILPSAFLLPGSTDPLVARPLARAQLRLWLIARADRGDPNLETLRKLTVETFRDIK